jgi:hypothetical protein
MPNVMAPLLATPRPDYVKCILPADPRDEHRKDSRYLSVYHGVQLALAELGFDKVRDRGPVPPYDFDSVRDACQQIRKEHPGATFIYNITGGTKVMAQAALRDAEAAREAGEEAWAVYVDTENGRLVTFEGEQVTPECYEPNRLEGIDVPRYFQAYGVTVQGGSAEAPPGPWLAAAEAVATSKGGPALMQALAKSAEPKMTDLSEVIWDVAGLANSQRESVERLVNVLAEAGVHVNGDQFTWPVTPESKDFIWRRHWLEWYAFACLQNVASASPAWHPPLRNANVVWPGWDQILSHDNELDVTATRNGRLLVCECKAGESAPTADNIYKLQVIGYKAGTFADKILVTATPNLTRPGGRTHEEHVVRALALDILLVGADNLPDLCSFFQEFDDRLYDQQTKFGLRRKM